MGYCQKQIVKRIPNKLIRKIALILIDPTTFIKWLGINDNLLKILSIIMMIL